MNLQQELERPGLPPSKTNRNLNQLVKTQNVQLHDRSNPFQLESGSILNEVQVAYETYGRLNEDGTNGILICHALTASAHAAGRHSELDASPGWWNDLIGPGRSFDTDRFYVVCPNILGSCYGTTGPTSLDPVTGLPYRMSFPQITIRDIVRLQKKLLEVLEIKRLVAVCGSSLGGMQTLEWPLMYPGFCKSIIPISTSAKQTAWCIALNSAARVAITGDPAWNNGEYSVQPAKGLALARTIGMISYRSPEEFENRFGRKRENEDHDGCDPENRFLIETYLEYQGEKLVKRFDANTYLYLTRATDSHDISRSRAALNEVLESMDAQVCCIGFSSDQRYPVRDQQEIVRHIPDAQLHIIESIHGHDGFLIEFEKLNAVISRFVEKLN